MRAVVQVCRKASLSVEEKSFWETGKSLMILLGFSRDDTEAIADKMIEKILRLRIFPDEAGKINLSASDAGASVCVISNFTLYADASSRRPSFSRAMGHREAEDLYRYFLDGMKTFAAASAAPGKAAPAVLSGVFGGDMLVEIHNDGPLTVILDSDAF